MLPIEDLKEGLSVYSYNFSKEEIELKTISKFFVREVDEVYEIGIGEEKIITVTEEHPFYVKDRGWVKVKDLRLSDNLITADGDIRQFCKNENPLSNNLKTY